MSVKEHISSIANVSGGKGAFIDYNLNMSSQKSFKDLPSRDGLDERESV